MKTILKIAFIVLILSSCKSEKEPEVIKPTDFTRRATNITNFDNYIHGKTYLPVYSHLYHKYEKRTFDLTIITSLRNVSATDTIYLVKADYFNTSGDNIRQYIKKPIFLRPMETVEIIIEEDDKEGGSGANFVFDWYVKNDKNIPLFEAVMISTYGQQGMSLSTRGVRIE